MVDMKPAKFAVIPINLLKSGFRISNRDAPPSLEAASRPVRVQCIGAMIISQKTYKKRNGLLELRKVDSLVITDHDCKSVNPHPESSQVYKTKRK